MGDVMRELHRRRLILIIEDDRDLRESLMEALEGEGYSVACAEDGQRALFYLRTSKRPDMILLDLQMPHMNGVEFRHAQLNNSELAGIPVAVITADALAREKVTSLALAGLLRKPLLMHQLFELVQRVVELPRRGEEL